MQKFTNLKWFIFDFLPDDRFQSEINIPIETTGVAAAVAVVVAAAVAAAVSAVVVVVVLPKDKTWSPQRGEADINFVINFHLTMTHCAVSESQCIHPMK